MKYILIVVICLLHIGCNRPAKIPQLNLQLKHTNTNHYKLRSLVNIKWNRLYICPPYTYTGMFDDYVLPYIDQVMNTGIRQRDDICVLLFFNDKKMVAQSVVSRDIDFASIAKVDKEHHLIHLTPDEEIGWVKADHGYYKVKLTQQ